MKRSCGRTDTHQRDPSRLETPICLLSGLRGIREGAALLFAKRADAVHHDRAAGCGSSGYRRAKESSGPTIRAAFPDWGRLLPAGDDQSGLQQLWWRWGGNSVLSDVAGFLPADRVWEKPGAVNRAGN